MEDWKERLVKEVLELNERYVKLEYFTGKDEFKKLDLEVQDLMRKQKHAMELYLYFLVKRIELYDINLPVTVNLKEK